MQGTILPHNKKPKKKRNLPWWFFILVILAGITGAIIFSLGVPAVLTGFSPEPTQAVLVVVPSQTIEETEASEPAKTATTAAATAIMEQASSTVSPSPTIPLGTTTAATPISDPLPTSTSVTNPAATTTFQAPTVGPQLATWQGEYFNNPNLAGPPVLYRNDANLYFDWGSGFPAPGLPADGFSARWLRTLSFSAGSYRINVQSDDGVRVWIDDQLIIDQWHDVDASYTTERYLAGEHILRVEYYENTGSAQIRLWWEMLDQFPQWRAEYFTNLGLYGSAALTRNDIDINFDWDRANPAPVIPADNFSVRWSRTLYFDEGVYRFHALVDDGVRFFIDDVLILNEWQDGSLREVTANAQLASGSHLVQVEYYDASGEAEIHVWWEKVAPHTYSDWKGEYWNNRQFRGGPTLVRNDYDIDFNWERGAPDSRLPADDFSARWSRNMRIEEGRYRFHTLADDGVRLYVDGTLLIDEWGDGRARETTGEINLSTGNHSFRVDYYERSGDARMHLWWEKIGPATYPEWKGEYWSNQQLMGSPTITRNDEKIDFDWKESSPANQLPNDNFSVRWSRQLNLQAGIHRLHAQADDGVRVFVDGKLLIDEWHNSNGSQTFKKDVALTAGNHQIVVEYYEHGGGAKIKFWRDRIGDLPTSTATYTSSPTPTMSPSPTATSTQSPSPTPSDTPTKTSTPTVSPTPTETTTPTQSPTPTMSSTPTETPSTTETPMPEPQAPTVYLNEVLPIPGSVDWNGDGQVTPADAWLELYNPGDKKIKLNSWHLQVSTREEDAYLIPHGTELRPGGYLVLYPLKEEMNLAPGNVIGLFDKAGKRVDQIVLPELPADTSYSRDAAGQWHADWPATPGEPNLPQDPETQDPSSPNNPLPL